MFFKKLMMFIASIILILLFGSNAKSAISDEEFILNFKQNIDNDASNCSPFYAISVSRVSMYKDDKNKYPQLQQKESEIVFQTLEYMMGREIYIFQIISEQFEEENNLKQIFINEFKSKYSETCAYIENPPIFLDRHIMSEFLDNFKMAKKEYVFISMVTSIMEKIIKNQESYNDNILSREIDIYMHENDMISILEDFPINEKKRFIDKNGILKSKKSTIKTKNNLTLIKDDVTKQVNSNSIYKYLEEKYTRNIPTADVEKFFELKKQIPVENAKRNRLQALDFLKKIRMEISGSQYLIVFNEMFFGKSELNKDNLTSVHEEEEKYAPLSFAEFTNLSNRFKRLSLEIPNSLFYVNYLYYSSLNISGEDYKIGVYKKISYVVHRKYNSFFSAENFELESMLEAINDQDSYSLFVNDTLTYANGRVLVKYRKSSYCNEANSILHNLDEKKSIYAFGDGTDVKEDHTDLAEYIHNNISSETCFDVEMKTRRNMNNYPELQKIHIITSNTLSLTDQTAGTQKRLQNLPFNSPLILHVDPKEQTLFLNSNKTKLFINGNQDRIIDHNIEKLIPFNPLSPNPFQIEIANNTFTFKIWNIAEALKHQKNY